MPELRGLLFSLQHRTNYSNALSPSCCHSDYRHFWAMDNSMQQEPLLAYCKHTNCADCAEDYLYVPPRSYATTTPCITSIIALTYLKILTHKLLYVPKSHAQIATAPQEPKPVYNFLSITDFCGARVLCCVLLALLLSTVPISAWSKVGSIGH